MIMMPSSLSWSAAVAITIFLVVLCSSSVVHGQQNMGMKSPQVGTVRGMNRDIGWKRDAKKAGAKLERMTRAVEVLERSPIPAFFKKDADVGEHNVKGPVIFAAAMSLDMRKAEANMFAKTARISGYDGDMVLAILPNSMPGFMEVLRETKAITYSVALNCTGVMHDKKCRISENGLMVSINMIRFYMYQWWARMYDPEALIMISDFRDVFFQGNPFTYHPTEWAPPVAQMVVFQEAYPNKVIYRCPFNSGWIENCYGKEGLNRVGGNTVSCSGVSIGTRNAILLYAHLVTQQLDPRVRMGRNSTGAMNQCVSTGMDQGFHNWLVYSGQLDKYMDLKVTLS
jgi:hypothetical protein